MNDCQTHSAAAVLILQTKPEPYKKTIPLKFLLQCKLTLATFLGTSTSSSYWMVELYCSTSYYEVFLMFCTSCLQYRDQNISHTLHSQTYYYLLTFLKLKYNLPFGSDRNESFLTPVTLHAWFDGWPSRSSAGYHNLDLLGEASGSNILLHHVCFTKPSSHHSDSSCAQPLFLWRIQKRK